MENNEITVVFERDLVCKNEEQEITFEANKEYQVSMDFFYCLSIKNLEKLTPESFLQNIKFVPQAKIKKMNKIKQSKGYSFQGYNNSLVGCVTALLEKHTDAAFEYLKAKRRLDEEKNICFTSEEREQFKNPMIVGKESLQLLYPEQKDYFDKLTDNELQKEIDKKLMLNIEYDKKLKRGNVLRDKEQSYQIDKIKKVKEEELYNELLKINEQYINYFNLDFLYRKIIKEKSNDGKLSDFQKKFVNVCGNVKSKNFQDVFERFAVLGPSLILSKGWKLCKFICQEKIRDCINKFKSKDKIDDKLADDFVTGLFVISLFLSNIPEQQRRTIIFPDNNNLDDMINKIIDILQDKKFRKHLDNKNMYRYYLFIELFAEQIIDNNDNNKNKEVLFRVIAMAPSTIKNLSPDIIFNNLDNKVVCYAFCQKFAYVSESVVNFCFDKNNKLVPNYEEKFKKMLKACPDLINNCNLDFIFDNLGDEVVWDAFYNGYDQYDEGKLFDYGINKDKKLIPERKEILLKLIATRPDLLINVYKDENKDKNYKFLYPLISKLILKKNRSLLHVFESMNYQQYKDFWTDYFGWFAKNLETKTKTQIKQRDINTELSGNLSEINTSISQNEQNKNNEPIIDIMDIEEENSFISEDNFKKIIECERFVNKKYQLYQENYWDSSENDLVWRALKTKWGFMWQEKTELFQIEISQAKYLQNHKDLSRDAREEVEHVFGYILKIETGDTDRPHGRYTRMVKKLEEYDLNYPGLSELKSYLPYLVIIHWSIHIAIIILSIAIVLMPWIFLSWGWGLGLSFITVPVCGNACIFCQWSLRYQEYDWAEKIFCLDSKLQKYAIRMEKYRFVTDLFGKFVVSELCFVGDKAWNQVKEYFRDNAPDLENKIKEYSGIENFNDIELDDVKIFIRRHDNIFMDNINNFFDNALTDKINSMMIDEIEDRFRDYVNQIDNSLSPACEKFINKNIVGHLDNIKEIFEIKGRCAYFRHTPNTNEQLMQDKDDLSHDLSELLWETLKKEHEKDKDIQKDNLNTDKKNESVNDNKPIVENEEEEIKTSSQQNF